VATTASSGGPAGSRSARSLLLTVLGEAVAPYGGAVWQESLVAALTTLDISTPAARQVVARAIREGWLSGERVGRRSLLTISETSRTMLEEARARVLDFGTAQEWDGRWLLAALTVPEEKRELRYQMRTQLGWLGFGSLGNGLWISPHVDRQDETVELMSGGDESVNAIVFVTTTSPTHTPAEIARSAWDLDALHERYTTFLTVHGKPRPSAPAPVFSAWIQMFTSWRHFPLFDPELPDSLLPARWPRARAHALFTKRNDEWADVALEYFRSLAPPGTGTQAA
jgi:phenylacetic acid degradation operon negative regulatory protein